MKAIKNTTRILSIDTISRCRNLVIYIPLSIESQWLSLYITFANIRLKRCASK